MEFETDRLLLRGWRQADREPFSAMNADLEVMRYFPAPLTRAESDQLLAGLADSLDRDGWGFWALESKQNRQLLGFAGLAPVGFEAHFTPTVEVGWRLMQTAWGHGYATEAANAALDLAFRRLGCGEVVSFTAASNIRSQAVMQRLGMTRNPADDFDHPQLPAGNALRRHVLYRSACGIGDHTAVRTSRSHSRVRAAARGYARER